MQEKYLYINTIGCQMNVYDSERIAGVLIPLGYHETDDIKKADLIIVNTCSIREKAEQKAFSFLGRLADMKKHNPSLIVGIGGCVAQQEGKKVIGRMPQVDIVFGTHAVYRLPEHIRKIESTGNRIVDVELSETIYEYDSPAPDKKPSGFVTIMRGCDNYCAYCVVPYVRGTETSRKPEHIISEIEGLVASGVREVTLLGQNVNSYGKKEGLCSFSEILARMNSIEGLLRIRFTTSHPKDLSDELIYAFRDLEKLCSHFHLPVQSGSNKILKKMNRKYTREKYIERVEKLREACPDIAVSSDIIAGFPGETEDDFQETLDLIKTVEFDSLFAFAYSDRPNAPAAEFSGKISEKEKNKRLREVLSLQEKYTKKKNDALVGKTEQILIEGFSKKQDKADSHHGSQDGLTLQWTGRTSANKIINCIQKNGSDASQEIMIGRMVHVRIKKAFQHSLLGELIEASSSP